MQYIVVDVRVNELQTQRVTVPPWEFLVLQAIHGDDAAQVEIVERDVERPDAGQEYDRLELKYKAGFDDDNRKSWVARVFGEFGEGISRLESVIEKASQKVSGRKTRAA